MPRRSFRIAAIIVATTLVALVVGALALRQVAVDYPDTANPGSGTQVEVEITSGMKFAAVLSLLSDKKLVSRPRWFKWFAMWKGATDKIRPGRYVLADNLSPRQLLATLVAGVKEVTAKVTLVPGNNILEYFAALERSKIAPARELLALASDSEFLASQGITGGTIEGHLFPDTYEFRVGDSPRRVLERLVARHRTVWNEVTQQHAADLAKLKSRLGWSDRDVLIMASIVEKEAVSAAERPTIAQVFINRLVSPSFQPKRLETDPTIRYGCLVPTRRSAGCREWEPDGILDRMIAGQPYGTSRLRRAQLDDADNPYNTYQHVGLPPGPICNPSRASIEATVRPDGSDYFYFVARSANEHTFSRTLAEHRRAVDAFVRSQR